MVDIVVDNLWKSSVGQKKNCKPVAQGSSHLIHRHHKKP